jgi:hypothetical protein
MQVAMALADTVVEDAPLSVVATGESVPSYLIVTLLFQSKAQSPEDSALQYGVLQAAVDFPAYH